jgi:sulfatase modifying factor 1
MRRRWILSALMIATVLRAHAADPVVTNVRANQRPGTELVDITYSVSDADGDDLTISVVIQANGSNVTATILTGDIGAGVRPGSNRKITWDAGEDWPGHFSGNTRVQVTANDVVPSGMVSIPGGTNSGTDPDFGAYSLTVSSFYMDKYEVTKALWDDVYSWAVSNGYSFDNAGSGKAANHPVHTVNWYDVVKWCNARSQKEGRPAVYTVNGSVYKTGQADNVVQTSSAGYRLPTDVEWEYAARGGLSGRRFPWGDTIQHGRANYHSSSSYSYDTSPTRGYHPTYNDWVYPLTSPVGSFTANGYGLYDISGNLWELCFDWHPSHVGSSRVIRGGSWCHDAFFCRVAIRYYYFPDSAYDFFGFRACLPPGQ